MVLCRYMCALSSEAVFSETSVTQKILNLKLNWALHLELHSNFPSNFSLQKNKFTKILQNAER